MALSNYPKPFHLSDRPVTDHPYSTTTLEFIGKTTQEGRESLAWLPFSVL